MLVISKDWSHHMRRSGYSVCLGSFDEAFRSSWHLLPGFIYKVLGQIGFNRFLVRAAEIKLLLKLLGCDQLFHTEGDYAQEILHYLRKDPNLKIVAVFHQPAEIIERLVCLEEKLDGAICLGRSQVKALTDLVPPGKLRVVPLGVDLDFFKPSQKSPECSRPFVLCVGSHLRDWDLLEAIAALLASSHPQVELLLVAHDVPREIKSVRRLKMCGDDELLRLQQTASVVLLPLKAGVANCALLEAMACGAPIVASETEDSREYGRDSIFYGNLGDPVSHYESVKKILNNSSVAMALRKSAREQAALFGLPTVSRQLYAAVEELFKEK